MNDHYLLFSFAFSLSRSFPVEKMAKRKKQKKREPERERKACQQTTKKMYRTLLIPF
jgi:hypothetical protein